MKRYSPSTRDAFVLVELLVLLGLFLIIAGTALWAFRMNMDVHRRTARHSARQAVMHAILDVLRSDMAMARAVQVIVENSPAPQSSSATIYDADGTEYLVCTLVIESNDGNVTYELRALPQPPPETPMQRRTRESGQSLIRTDRDGSARTWSLHGQYLTFVR